MATKKTNKKPKIERRQFVRRQTDFRESVLWRIFRIMAEFVDGFQFLADMKRSVTFFGSARFTADVGAYKEARRLAYLLGKEGFAVITGGGPGIMEAANRGAYEANGESIGLNIQLVPTEQRINDYVKKGLGFHYFFTRKVMLAFSSQAYVFFPGGFGTIDEMSEILTLIQTNKISRDIPVVLVGKDYWEPLLKWFKETMYDKYKAIDEADMKLYHMVDSADEAFKIIKKSKERKEVF